MKVFILCGGFGTRLDDKGKLTAKTMIKVGKDGDLIEVSFKWFECLGK